MKRMCVLCFAKFVIEAHKHCDSMDGKQLRKCASKDDVEGMLAILGKHSDATEREAIVASTDSDGYTALHKAASKNAVKAARFLIEKYAI